MMAVQHFWAGTGPLELDTGSGGFDEDVLLVGCIGCLIHLGTDEIAHALDLGNPLFLGISKSKRVRLRIKLAFDVFQRKPHFAQICHTDCVFRKPK